MTPIANLISAAKARSAPVVLASAAAFAVFVFASVPSALAVAELAVPTDAASAVSAAGAKLAVDGDLSDLAAYVTALQAAGVKEAIAEEDAAGDVRVFDPTIVAGRAIEHHYFANGFDQSYDLFAYDRATRTLRLGLRVAGAIGDADGDGDADANAPTSTVIDEKGIGADDMYAWTVRAKDSGPASGIAIVVSNGELKVHGAAGAAGEFAFSGSSLEVVVRGIDLPPSFEARVAVGNLGDGLGEDTHLLGAGDEAAVASIADEPDPIGVKPGNGPGGEPVVQGQEGARGQDEASADAGRVGANGANGTDASAAGGLVPAVEAASDGIAVLGRAYPNPFAASVTFGFEVKSAGQSVDVGVYDVTGRLVTRLASGPHDVGRASVQWDGKDDGGVRMAPGVYFLKANVGGVSKVQRLVRVDG